VVAVVRQGESVARLVTFKLPPMSLFSSMVPEGSGA
jgi:hypothetical protein